jgi:hypothetical protein
LDEGSLRMCKHEGEWVLPFHALGQKQFVLTAKMHLCWWAQHPPPVLCQHKWLSLLAGASRHPEPLAGDISARQHSGFSKSA